MKTFSPGRAPAELIKMHAEGKSVVCAGRYSQPYACKQAVNDFMDAADYLAECGLDIRQDLPPRQRLEDMLKATTPIRSTDREGNSFDNWVLVLDMRATHGVVGVISCGSGHKLANDSRQPFVERLAEIMEEFDVVALFACRIDRLTRVSWAFAPVVIALEHSDGYLADARRGFTKANGPESILTFFEVRSAESEAAKIPLQTRRGQRSGTDMEVVGGKFRLGTGFPLPPGMFAYRERRGGALGGRIGTFDSPTYFPALKDVAYGVPEVLDSSGELADQVKTIRWALSVLGRPGWRYQEVAIGLAARGFSTEGLRRQRGMDASFTFDEVSRLPLHFVRIITDHLEFYESGTHFIQLGVEGIETIEIRNCFPPDGLGWASPEDFARIKVYMESLQRMPSKGLTFARVPVSINGEECLFTTHSYPRSDGSLRYTLGACYREHYGRDFTRLRPKLKVYLPPDLLNRALVEAVIAAGENAYPLVEGVLTKNLDEALMRELAMARTALREKTREMDALREQLLERNVDGSPVLSGALLRDLNDRYNHLSDEEIPRATQLVNQCQGAIDRAQTQAQESLRGATLAALLHLVASLRDPFDTRYRDLIARSVRDCVMTSSSREVDGVGRLVLNISFSFVVSDGDLKFAIPVGVEYVDGLEFEDRDQAVELLEKLKSEPRTMKELITQRNTLRYASAALARLLGINNRKFMLPRVEIPELSQLVALVLDTEDLEAVAHQTGQPLEFLERIKAVHTTSPEARWRKMGWSPLISAMYDIAAEGNAITPANINRVETGVFRRLHQRLQQHRCRPSWQFDGNAQSWSLLRCRFCGSARRRPALIPEPNGLVCQDCRRDEKGLQWPADLYDAYLYPSSTAVPARQSKRKQ